MNQKQLETLRRNNAESREFTRNCIYSALMVFLSKNDLKDISISRLCEVAGVSRAAFYRNYANIEDVLVDKIAEFGRRVTGKIGPDIYDNWLMLFTEAEKERDLFTVVITLGIQNVLFQTFVSLLPKEGENRTVQAIWISIYYAFLIKRFQEKHVLKIEDEARLAYKYTKNIPLVAIENEIV